MVLQLLSFLLPLALGQAVSMTLDARWTPLVWMFVGVVLFLRVILDPWVLRRLAPVARKRPVMSSIVACVFGAAVFGGGYQAVTRAHGGEREQSFSVSIVTALVSDSPNQTSLFMVGYHSMYGMTLSPISYLCYFQLVNERNIPVTVSGFSLEVSDQADGPWEALVPIPLRTTKLFALGVNKPPVPPAAPEALAHAAPMNAALKLEEVLSAPILPHSTASGWAAFDVRDRGRAHPRRHFRLKIRDASHGVFAVNVVAPQRNDFEVATDIASLQRAGEKVDLGRAHIRYFGDPYR